MRLLSRIILRMLGWKTEGRLPQLEKYVIITAPHTSMYDFALGKLFLIQAGLDTKILMKKELFFFPLGILLKKIGGIPVDRSKRNQTIEKMVNTFLNSERFVLAIAPEGTRQKVESWKTGFYLIAFKSHVAILPAYCDYKRKVFGIGEAFIPTGNMEQDISILRRFFANVTPRHPDRNKS